MKLEKLSKEHLKVLARIQNSIPKEWTNNATHKEKATSVIEEVIEKALVDPEVSDEIKAKCLMIKNSGQLYKEIEVDNPKITKLIEQFIDREIAKAIKRGELPPRAKESGKNIKRIIKAKNGNKN